MMTKILNFHYLNLCQEAGTAYPSGAHVFTPVFSGVRCTRSLVLYVCFVDRCSSFCTFSFGHCLFSLDLRILITSLVSSNSSKELEVTVE